MIALKSQLFRAGLSALWYSGAARACARWTAGKGAILMLHRVQPGPAPAFAPNARLSISPDYLRSLLVGFRAADIDVVSLDEALARMRDPTHTRRFVCFTFDDGYRDNLEHALPIFRRFRAPFTVYATTSFLDRTLAPWWVALERVIAQKREVAWVSADSEAVLRYSTASLAEKRRVFAELTERFMSMTAAELPLLLARFLNGHGFSMCDLAESEMCSWSELRSLHDAGVEIGCHAVSHARLRCETPETVRDELSRARSLLEAQLSQPVRHLAYPYGKPEHVGPRDFAIARELGFASAVTTRPGCIFAAHTAHPHGLPRVEVTPSFEASPHFLQAILSGLPLLARNGGRMRSHE
ncbi:MAG TPA: polysaccharide deacetylase family protein [Polyangiales bacterium]|nr:polysaccharide deacetylase family protein [Polyangiales bacterium]